MAEVKINFESEIKEAKKLNFFEKFMEKINPKKFKDFDWERWKRRNLNWGGVGRVLWWIARFIIIVGISFMILYPFVVRICVSFMSTDDLTDKTVMFIPRNFSTYFFERAILNMDYWNSMLLSALLSLVVSIFQLIVSCLSGYGFARFNFKGKNLLFFIVLMTLIIPSQTIILPLYVRFRYFIGNISLLNTMWPLIIMSATGLGLKNGLYIYLMRQFFRGMPKELEMSAYIDGAGPIRTFVSIMMPNAFNMMITVFLFSFTWQWTDTTYNSMLMSNLNILSNTVSDVTNAVSDTEQQQAIIDTGLLLMIAPLLIVFLFAQRYFIQGIERSGLVE